MPKNEAIKFFRHDEKDFGCAGWVDPMAAFRWQWRRKDTVLWSLVSLAILISFLSFLVVALPLFLGVQHGHASLARDVQNLTSANVVDQLVVAAVAPVDTLAALSASLARMVLIDSSFVTPSSARLQRLLFGHSQVAGTGLLAGFPDGQVTGYLGGALDELRFVESLHGAGIPPSLWTFNTDFGGSLTAANSTVMDYDVRREKWYEAATRENSTAWRSKRRVKWAVSELLPNSKIFALTASRPIFYGSTVVAVLAMHFPLAGFSNALNATKIGISGQAFVFDQSGWVLGLSSPTSHNFTFDKLVHATALEDPMFQSLLRYLMKRSNGSYALIPQFQANHVLLAGCDYLLTTRLITSKDLHWTGVIVVPRSDYFGAPERAFSVSVVFAAIAALLLCGVVVWCVAVLHTDPLLRLAQGLETVAETFGAEVVPSSGSLVREVSAVETAYEHMITALQEVNKYIPSPVVQKLAVHRDRNVYPDVSSRECSFLFADIVGFVAISECTPAQQMHEQLSEYFGAMENILQELNGITTDFLGDGLFVFWNAPIDQADHAILACEAALRQQARLEILRREWISRNRPALYVRIGINTGMCLVGSFGSYRHLKYTAMGDAVNTASRLEQLNKYFETSIIIGEATFLEVQHVFLARPLDVVVLLGKTTPVKVYELISRKSDATREQTRLAELSTQLLDAFVAADFAAARNIAVVILEHTPEDMATSLLLERCNERRPEDRHCISPRFAKEK